MGAGRRTETVHFNSVPGTPVHKTAPQRKLAERGRLSSVVFGCTSQTFNECVTNKIFGLPYAHINYVDHIVPGMPLFLFNYNDRKMHGIYEAASDGGLYISHYAWTGGTDGAKTQFPAQVRVKLRSDFTRLISVPETIFRDILIDNYFKEGHFYFEVDSEQTDRLIRLFEDKAGLHQYRPTAAPKVSSANNAWQPATPSKVWKTREAEDKLKQPAKMVFSEDGKAQYIPSTSKDAIPDEDMRLQQASYWNRRPSNGEDDLSDESDDIQPSYAAPEPSKPEQDPVVQMRLANGYKPKLNGSSESQASVSEDGLNNSRAEGLTTVQREVASDAMSMLSRLQVGSVPKETPQLQLQQQPPQLPQQQLQLAPVQTQRDGELATRNSSDGTSEWERMARDRSVQEQAVLREEREKLGATLSDLDYSVAMTVKKNLELYAMAIGQMRQDGMELRRLLDDARMRTEELERVSSVENNQADMAAEIEALKREVADLRGQLDMSGPRAERIQENGSSQLVTVDPPEAQIPPSIYLIGGLGDQLSRLESVMVWSPATDRLRTAAPMLTPRCCSGASVLDGHIYVFGGGDGKFWHDTVERYDRQEDQWVSCAPMKEKRGSLGGASVGDRIYAVGGGNGDASFADVESYDPYLGTWLPCTPMFDKRFCVAATELDGALYALGGFDGEQYLMTMERFDPREALWTQMPPMTVKRGSLSAAILNGKIYALGGYDGDKILDVVETFDPRANRWDLGEPMCCRRAYGAVATVGDALYYMGGLAENVAVDSEQGSFVMNGSYEDRGAYDGEDGGYRSWRSQWQASWQQYTLGSSVPGLTINASFQIQRFTETSGWQSMRPRVIGKRSCLSAVVF